MIKNYLELSNVEVEKLVKFINRNKTNKLSLEDMDKELKTEKFDFGRGVIIKFHNEEIIGRASIILKECAVKKVAYVFDLDVDENVENKSVCVCEIIDKIKSITMQYGLVEAVSKLHTLENLMLQPKSFEDFGTAQDCILKHTLVKIFLGTKEENIIKILNSLNIERQYSSIEMSLEDRKIRYSPLELIMLSENNKKAYLEIYNDAFKEVPNGATLTDNEIDEYIKKADESNCYYIVKRKDEMIGFLQFNIEGNSGEFDLGLIKSARGKGYGKLLLETAISFLNSKNVTDINLIVITKNTVAYDMYKKRGFKQTKLINEWFSLN